MATWIALHIFPWSGMICLSAGVGVHSSLSASQGNVDETAGVLEALESTTLGGLLLLLGLDLGGLRLDLSGTSERSVNFAHFDGFVVLLMWMVSRTLM
jgi:hypothetical protein